MTNEIKLNLGDQVVRVIIPAYNAAPTIRRAIDSVLKQTYKSVDLVVIDDASTDETYKILLEYDTKSVCIIQHDRNHGVAAALNSGLTARPRHTLGAPSLVAYLGADDWWDPTHLEQSVKFMIKEGADLVYSDPNWESHDGHPTGPTWEVGSNFDPDIFLVNNCMWAVSVVHRYDSKLGLYDTALNSLEDWDMWLRAYRQGWKVVKGAMRTTHYWIQPVSLAGKSDLVIGKFLAKNMDIVRKPIRLNLGCGDDVKPGWINVDTYNEAADVKSDVKSFDCPDNSVDIVLASHIIEHLQFSEAYDVLLKWKRMLKPGGKLIVETPDFLATCRDFVNADEAWRVQLYGQFFATPWIPGQVHYFLYTETQLSGTLAQCGYRNIVRVPPESRYATRSGAHHLFLRMEAVK